MADSRILDQQGKPFKLKDLAEPQTSRIASLHSEFAGHPSRGLTPARLACILEQAEQGDIQAQSDLFEDMEDKDGHIFAEMQKRKLALQTLDWDIVAPRNASSAEKSATDKVKELMQGINDFEDVIFDMADAIGKGFACLEFNGWTTTVGERLPSAITWQPQRWFMVDKATRRNLRLRNNTPDGEDLNPFGWIVHRHKAKSGLLTRNGLHRVLSWPYLFKNYSVRDLAEFLEIYGLPLRLGTYPSGATDKEKSTLMRAVVNIGHAAAGIVPEGMMVEFKEAAKGNKDPFEAMISWCERTQSKVILGATLTSQADGKSSTNALGNVHNEVRHDITHADARQLASTLTRDLVYPIAMLNTTGIEGLHRCPRFVFDCEEPEDLALYSDAIPKLVGVGVPIPVSHVQQKLNIPVPQDDEPVLQRASEAPPNDTVAELVSKILNGGCPSCGVAALKHSPQHKDVANHYVDQLDERTQAAFEKLTDPVQHLVNNATNMAELATGLLKMFEEMDEADLAQAMGDAFAAAELAGRFEVQEGN
ncbi:MAG TPA: DUF935 domain-containing protein [Chromatiales bacterium]|nr:DUF935 domain-containing protein [Chromatiales bacterium]HEX22785.1 DUF935 domain-containing protein [Chromatiales bacterium]